ncbi:hypothetical protein B0J14DRAFT_673019 [Halenospora varia]|nr:hypothetical protein B0J14DRAFT_673019 [Halenospora varia]
MVEGTLLIHDSRTATEYEIHVNRKRICSEDNDSEHSIGGLLDPDDPVQERGHLKACDEFKAVKISDGSTTAARFRPLHQLNFNLNLLQWHLDENSPRCPALRASSQHVLLGTKPQLVSQLHQQSIEPSKRKWLRHPPERSLQRKTLRPRSLSLRESKSQKPKAKPTASKKSPTVNYDSHMEDTITAKTKSEDGPNFTLFPELPLELRLKIWGYAAPEPQLIVQRRSEKNNSRFTYRRKVPAILHACRESRLEYLDTGKQEDQASADRRRQSHPLYKLCFQSDRVRSSPVYFSNDIDMFYGAEDPGKMGFRRAEWRQRQFDIKYHGMTELDISDSLKHLVIEVGELTERGDLIARLIHQGFPKLEKLTCLVKPGAYHWPPVRPGPEVDGAMDLDSLQVVFYRRVYNENKNRLTDMFERTCSADYPHWTPPTLKFRFREQFTQASTYTR